MDSTQVLYSDKTEDGLFTVGGVNPNFKMPHRVVRTGENRKTAFKGGEYEDTAVPKAKVTLAGTKPSKKIIPADTPLNTL